MYEDQRVLSGSVLLGRTPPDAENYPVTVRSSGKSKCESRDTEIRPDVQNNGVLVDEWIVRQRKQDTAEMEYIDFGIWRLTYLKLITNVNR